MPRVPLRSTYARPPEGDSGPSRLDVLNSSEAPSWLGANSLVGWVQPIELLRWASPILRSEAHRTTLSLLISGTDQQTTPNAPSGG